MYLIFQRFKIFHAQCRAIKIQIHIFASKKEKVHYVAYVKVLRQGSTGTVRHQVAIGLSVKVATRSQHRSRPPVQRQHHFQTHYQSAIKIRISVLIEDLELYAVYARILSLLSRNATIVYVSHVIMAGVIERKVKTTRHIHST